MTNKALVEALRDMTAPGSFWTYSQAGQWLEQNGAALITALASSGNATGDDKGLVERVAEAIHASSILSKPGAWESFPNDLKEHWRVYARAAIAALSSGNEVAKVVGWQPIKTAPKGKWVIGKRDPQHTGRAPAFVGTLYDMHENALLDEWSGRWAVCTHWAPLPDHLASDAAPLTGGGGNG